MKVIAVIADHPTPKFNKGGVAYTMNSRDYKAPLVVVTSYSSGSHGRYTEGAGTLRASGGDTGGWRNFDR